MAEHGGYRAPTNPAPVAGPGPLSRRTDGGPGGKQPVMTLPDAKYGENKAFVQQQQGAPMMQAPNSAPMPSGGGPAPTPSPPPPLSAGTMAPSEPITAGIDSGPGPDSSVLTTVDPTASQYQSFGQLVQTLASRPGASPAVQQLVAALSRGF